MSSSTLNNAAHKTRAGIRVLALAGAGIAALAMGACSHAARPDPAPVGHPVSAAPQPVAPGAGTPAVSTGAHPEVPPAARADFNRAVQLMRAGNTSGAEQAFRQLAAQYPQFAAPLVNVGLMQRKQGQLDQAEASLKGAVASESGSAVAWTELGVTQRVRGEFTDAAVSYQRAIDADALYAPAWRNLGVVQDLYLGDPAHALASFEQYKQLTGEEKPVSGWIAELRQRLGIKRPEVAAPPKDGAAPAPGAATPSDAPPPAPPAAAPKTGA